MQRSDDLFSIGEVAKYQNISKQTLIFYDKIGLFRPAWVDPDNGYRYYSAKQLDELDAILIMKTIGFSLAEIREHMRHYNIDSSLDALHRQLAVIDRRIGELRQLRSRVQHRCAQMEQVRGVSADAGVTVADQPAQYILCRPVDPPHTLREISIATKQCFADSFAGQLPLYFQCGGGGAAGAHPRRAVHPGQPRLSAAGVRLPRPGRPAAARRALRQPVPCGGLPVHRPQLPKAAGILRQPRAGDRLGFL